MGRTVTPAARLSSDPAISTQPGHCSLLRYPPEPKLKSSGKLRGIAEIEFRGPGSTRVPRVGLGISPEPSEPPSAGRRGRQTGRLRSPDQRKPSRSKLWGIRSRGNRPLRTTLAHRLTKIPAPKESAPISRHPAIDCITPRPRKKPQQGQRRQRSAYRADGGDQRISPNQGSHDQSSRPIWDKNHAIEILGWPPTLPQKNLRRPALQRRKPQPPLAICLQKQPHQTNAEAAFTIEKQNRTRVIHAPG
jgi:hypothetical protein